MTARSMSFSFQPLINDTDNSKIIVKEPLDAVVPTRLTTIAHVETSLIKCS